MDNKIQLACLLLCISLLGFDDIGYHYLIGGDGTVFEGRGGRVKGAHSPGYNNRSIGVCLLGDFTKTLPTTDATTSLKRLHACLQIKGVLSVNNSVFGHRDARPTECPGSKFYSSLHEEFGDFWHRIKPEMWTNCRVDGGTCLDVTKVECEGRWKTDLCPGPTEIKCCIPE
ncbi:peptidoglycan-recognition protein SB1-like [Pecten maximus]|uniref:peptidoglycan-recognition protein SB1-like n=1 Tax=Pecten maximus TaxID=6579 RepID=UPI001459155E|nr:peptidoglycan-recognition protein SB1-like [Pecten maximus]